MSKKHIPADATGLLALAALAGVVAWPLAVIYSKSDAIWAWSVGFPILAVSSLIAWHHDKWPTDSGDLLRDALISIPVGTISFMIDAAISTANYPRLAFRYAIWHAGSPFGIPLTIMICPGFTLIALAGIARAALYKPEQARPLQPEGWMPVTFGLSSWKKIGLPDRSRSNDEHNPLDH